MEKKKYNGLEIESILFGKNEIKTGSTSPDDFWIASGCTLGSMAFYTEDMSGQSMPLGTCYWETTDDLSFQFANPTGGFS